MSPSPTSGLPPSKQAKPSPERIIKFCLLALPIGTALLGIASIFIFYGNRNAEAERAAAGIDRRLQASFRVPASEASFEGYRRTLDDVLGLDDPTKVANYLESTLGQSNLGYRTRRSDTAGFPQVEAIIEGPAPVVVISAPYDKPGAAAALLTLAADLAGETPKSEVHLTAHHSSSAPRAAAVLDGSGGVGAISKISSEIRK